MKRDPILRLLRATLVAMICLLVAVATGLSPASAHGSAQFTDRPHIGTSCPPNQNKAEDQDKDSHNSDRDTKRHKHHKPRPGLGDGSPSVSSDRSPVIPPPVTAKRVGPPPGHPSAGGGRPTEPVPTIPAAPRVPSGSALPPTTAGPTPAISGRSKTTTSGVGAAARAPLVVTTPAGPAAPTSGSTTAAADTQSSPTLRPAPTGGGQLPDAARPAPPIHSAGAAATSSRPAPPSPSVAAIVRAQRTNSLFGVDSSILLAAMLAVFALGVGVMVAGGHRPLRRTH